MKRGQVTIFVILGLVIIVAVGFVVVYKDTLFSSPSSLKEKETISLTQSQQEIKSMVESCLKSTGNKAIILAGYQGFYITPPKQSVDYMIYKVPYLYDNGINRVPSPSVIEKQLSDYVNNNVKDCYYISDDVEYGEAETTTEIQNDRVFFYLKLPVKITKGESVSELDSFNAEVPVRLGELYAITKTFVENSDKEKLCLSCLLDISLQNNLYTEVVEIDDDVVIIFNDQKSKIDETNYVLQFGVNYEK